MIFANLWLKHQGEFAKPLMNTKPLLDKIFATVFQNSPAEGYKSKLHDASVFCKNLCPCFRVFPTESSSPSKLSNATSHIRVSVTQKPVPQWDRLVQCKHLVLLTDKEGEMHEDANDDEAEGDGKVEAGQELVGEQLVVRVEPAVGVQQQQLPSSSSSTCCLRRPAVCPLYASVGQSHCARAHLRLDPSLIMSVT